MIYLFQLLLLMGTPVPSHTIVFPGFQLTIHDFEVLPGGNKQDGDTTWIQEEIGMQLDGKRISLAGKQGDVFEVVLTRDIVFRISTHERMWQDAEAMSYTEELPLNFISGHSVLPVFSRTEARNNHRVPLDDLVEELKSWTWDDPAYEPEWDMVKSFDDVPGEFFVKETRIQIIHRTKAGDSHTYWMINKGTYGC